MSENGKDGFDADDGDWRCGDAAGIPRLRSLPRAQACRRRAVRLVVFRTLTVFVVKEMICLNYRKLKPLRGR